MCGIAGIFGIHGKPVAAPEVQAMCDALRSRGPDDEGYYIQGNVGLGMRRLSIIDLETGHQPVHNEDGTVHLVLNGEIYNYRELREQMQARGHTFYTATDTEVIVHLYEEYGLDCVQHLRGMFGFALWDSRLGRLLLVRDRLGIKPLFYGEVGGRLVFASELKAILQLAEVERNLDWSAVGHLFSFLSTPRDESIISGIHKLEPGHMLTQEAGKTAQISCYWDVQFEADYQHDEAYFVQGVRERLEEAVRLRMISDVPVGAFLSGGIDSSAVVATMARLSSLPVQTFSIGFPEKEYDESHHAKQLAEHLGTDHHELILEPDVLSIVDDMAWDLDEPFGDSSAIPTYMVSKLAARQVKVVLSGDGGDEIFAGYDKYLVEQRERNYRHIPGLLRRMLGTIGGQMPLGMKGRNFLRHIALDGPARYVNAQTLFNRAEQTSLFSPEVADRILAEDPWADMAQCLGRAMDQQGGHWLSALQYLDIKNYLPLDILTKVDRMSMAQSLEARVPLLDHKLVEFAATIPPEYKLKDGCTKYILKKAMRGILPDATIDRQKKGFAVPLGRWFRGELEPFVRDLLLSETSRARGIFNPDYIERLIAIQQGGRSMEQQLWTLISFELWCRTFLDQPCAFAQRDSLSTVSPESSGPANTAAVALSA